MGVSLSIIQPQVSIVIDGEDPQVLAAIDADTLNGVTAGTTGLLLLATATAGAARTVLGVDSDDAVTFGALTAPSVQATASGGLLLKNSSGTTVATIGAGPGTGTTLAGALALSGAITGATTIAASAGITSATNVIGTDPGGSELLRVGGSIRANGATHYLGASPGSVANSFTKAVIQGTDAVANDLILAGPNGSQTRIHFSTPSQPEYGAIRYNHTTNVMTILANNAQAISIGSGGTTILGTDPGGSELLRVGGSVNIATGSTYKVNAVQVVAGRDTGWTAMTNTANKNTSYDTTTVTLAQLASRVKSLQDALATHGLIGA